MNKIEIFLLFLPVFFIQTSCFTPSKISRECLYQAQDVKAIDENLVKEKFKKAVKSYYQKLDIKYTELFYFSKDLNLAPKHTYAILILFDKEKFYVLNIDGNLELKKAFELASDDRAVVKIKNLTENLSSQFYVRDCLGSDSLESIFQLVENGETLYYYKSIGFDCEVPDKDNLLKESYPLIKELINQGYVSI
ncbi:MAG: hypothetical protein AAF849_02450 [Bacteroidota bacterium]